MILLLAAAPAMAADEADVGAAVEVLPGENYSYGYWVTDSRHAFLSWWALGEPDNRGATLLRNSRISIGLEDKVTDTGTISIWASNSGWWSSRINVYTSASGRWWRRIGSRQVWSAVFTRYDFTGRFGNVKYIRVELSGGGFSTIRLDAVGAKGGDESRPTSNKDNAFTQSNQG